MYQTAVPTASENINKPVLTAVEYTNIYVSSAS